MANLKKENEMMKSSGEENANLMQEFVIYAISFMLSILVFA